MDATTTQLSLQSSGVHTTTQIVLPDRRQLVKFYHKTTCKICTKDNICANTHRTDFVGFAHANRAFDITNHSKISSPLYELRDLVDGLLRKQGRFFFLNEFPEECSHLQFIDLDANVPDALLDALVVSLEDLTIGGEVLVLRNTVSSKVHLIMNVPASTHRHSYRKRAIARWLCSYLYHNAGVAEWYTEKQWQDEVFDAGAAGIRSALSAKVKNGELEANKGVYAPPGVAIDRLTFEEKVDIIIKYSIYNEPRARWTGRALYWFDQAEKEYEAEKAVLLTREARDNYNAEKRTIPFFGGNPVVDGTLIDTFISFLPSLWCDKKHWFFTLKQVKTAALLVADFDPRYFLHTWSKQNETSYNEAGNNDRYTRCQTNPQHAGAALTWLKDKAVRALEIDKNLSRNGDLGLSLVFAEIAAGSIKVTNDGSCYLWDTTSCLWQHHNSAWVGNEIRHKLSGLYLEHVEKLRRVKSNDANTMERIAKKIKQWDARRERIMNYRPAMDVMRVVLPMLEDEEFINQINLQPDLLPIKDGLVVDLRTGQTSPRLPTHNFTFECHVNLDRTVENRLIIQQFMLDICCGDHDLLKYLQVALGYCITGRVNEKAIFVWWGALGDNGKSTVMNLLKAVLGQYCKSASKCLFIKAQSDSKLTPEREVLKGTRLVMFSETAVEDELNDELLKMASGDDLIRVNPKYQAEYEFKSYAKLLLASNHKPRINVSDEAMVHRIKFCPFLTKFVDRPTLPHERAKNGQLVRRIETELLDAFFTWVLDGAISWYEHGLVDIPVVMQQATAEFIAENDELEDFLAEEIEPAVDQVIHSSVLHGRYSDWCLNRRAKAKGLRAFSQDMEKKYKKERKRTGFVFIGLKFKETSDI